MRDSSTVLGMTAVQQGQSKREKNVTIFGLRRVVYRLHVVFPPSGEPHMLLCAYSHLISSAIHGNSPLLPTLTR
jgi:hypothetical protein